MQRSSAGWQGPSFPNSRSCDTRLCEPLCKPLYGRWFERCKKSKRPWEIGCEKRSALGQRLLKTKPVCQQTMQKRRKQAKPAPTSKRPPVASRRPCEPTHHLFRALIALAAVQPQAPGRRRCAGTPCAGARHEEEQWWLDTLHTPCAYAPRARCALRAIFYAASPIDRGGSQPLCGTPSPATLPSTGCRGRAAAAAALLAHGPCGTVGHGLVRWPSGGLVRGVGLQQWGVHLGRAVWAEGGEEDVGVDLAAAPRAGTRRRLADRVMGQQLERGRPRKF